MNEPIIVQNDASSLKFNRNKCESNIVAVNQQASQHIRSEKKTNLAPLNNSFA